MKLEYSPSPTTSTPDCPSKPFEQNSFQSRIERMNDLKAKVRTFHNEKSQAVDRLKAGERLDAHELLRDLNELLDEHDREAEADRRGEVHFNE